MKAKVEFVFCDICGRELGEGSHWETHLLSWPSKTKQDRYKSIRLDTCFSCTKRLSSHLERTFPTLPTYAELKKEVAKFKMEVRNESVRQR